MGLSEAATATGVNRSTIYRAWKAGRISATRTEAGQIEVEPVELFRVFAPIAQGVAPQGEQDATHPHAQADKAGDNALHGNALAHEVHLLRETLATMRQALDAAHADRDAWRDQARKEGDERRELSHRLALAAPIAAPAEPRRSWWRRLVG